jgi:UDP-N-acetylmuramate dehydrogenase
MADGEAQRAWRRDVPLAPLTTLGVGGQARWLAEALDGPGLVAAIDAAVQQDVPWWIVGGGSNVLIADAGLPGLVVRPVGGEATLAPDGTVRADAGVTWDELVRASVERGLGGIECLSGIPGLCGAAPIQNIGAYGQEVADVLESVDVFDTRTGQVTTLPALDCGFGYRDSRFKREPGHHVVLAVTLRLQPNAEPCVRYAQVTQALGNEVLPRGQAGLARVREAVLALRRGKSMVLDPADPDSRSAGSFFTNPLVTEDLADAVQERLAQGLPMPRWLAPEGQVKLSAAWLIEHSGMQRGYGEGPVGLSRNHTLALVNRGLAQACEVVAFARHVQDRVESATGVRLHAEPVLLGFEGNPLA